MIEKSVSPELPLKDSLRIEVRPRQPRLAWQGMDRKEAVAAVPTQVVEIVRPGRAIERGDELAGVSSRAAAAREETAPENRLIWTNDNLVALQTLLDEREPKSGGYRYRGKVDLVYIDPPFMVNSNFLAENSVGIELDKDVKATKEPSLVEILAYKDTWRQGLDSFLSMLKRRLLVLKDLLAPTASIYVHLDWHAVHYVKVLMDDIFGYENFVNEIIWPSTNAHNDADRFGNIHQTLLIYAAGEKKYFSPPRTPYSAEYIAKYFTRSDENGKFRPGDLTAPGGRGPRYVWKGVERNWRLTEENMRALERDRRIFYTENGIPRRKEYLADLEGAPVQSIWLDEFARYIVSWSGEDLGYPTQKSVALVERVISASCPPGGLVLDCFLGSGTTAEAAERLGRRWIGIDNGKYGIHLARKRLIQLHGQTRSVEKPQYEYVECEECKHIERKEKQQKSRERFQVRPFTVENMGVYQRAAEWQDFQKQHSKYRDEMLKVFGAEPVSASPLLHGRKGLSWVHIGPLDGPVSSHQVWAIAREAQRTDTKAVTILSADFDAVSNEREEISAKTGVAITIRIIPASAIHEVRERLRIKQYGEERSVESMAVPAFYSPLSIVLGADASGRSVKVALERCEVDIQSFLDSQRPLLKPLTDKLSAAQKKRVQAEHDRWANREKELKAWLAKAKSWQSFVDYWAIDWDYGSRQGDDGKPIFETDWQSFRVRRGKEQGDPLVFTAEFRYEVPGKYLVAARVTDVFGNDGIATIDVRVK